MSVTFACPHCHQVLRAPDTDAGKVLACRVCQQPVTVPRNVAAPSEVSKSRSGRPVYRHQAPTETPIETKATPFLQHIDRHIERTIGRAPMVNHELVSEFVHIDLYVVPPIQEGPSEAHPFGRNHYTVITSGISSKPMNVPPDSRSSHFLELMIVLPADWPGMKPDGTFDSATMKDPANWWPLRCLKQIARVPSMFNTCLDVGHTVPNGEEAAPYASNTRLGCMLVTHPYHHPKSAKLVVNDNVSISFLSLTPIYPEEMNLKLSKGLKELDQRFDKAGVTDMIQANRPNVAMKRGVLGWFGRR